MTTEASSTTMSWATAMTARARKRLGSPPGGVDSACSEASKVKDMCLLSRRVWLADLSGSTR